MGQRYALVGSSASSASADLPRSVYFVAQILFAITKALRVTIGELCGETLKDQQVAEMRAHLIPVNDRRIWKVLKPLLSSELQNVVEWEAILRQALEGLGDLQRVDADAEENGGTQRMAG